jgi:hypothetical protein
MAVNECCQFAVGIGEALQVAVVDRYTPHQYPSITTGSAVVGTTITHLHAYHMAVDIDNIGSDCIGNKQRLVLG